MKMNLITVSFNKYEHMSPNIADDKKWEPRTVKLLDKTVDTRKQCLYKVPKDTYSANGNTKIFKFKQVKNSV